jgi:hypothetical protein
LPPLEKKPPALSPAIRLFGNRWLPLKTCAKCIGSSGGFLPPSPPPDQPAARQDQAGQARTPETHASKGVLTVNGQHTCKLVGD